MLRDALAHMRAEQFTLEYIFIRPIRDDEDLWFATVECRLKPGQADFVNPAGFSIGRAYLNPEWNVPCVICRADGQRIGFLVFRQWIGASAAYDWSYYLDRQYQGQGFDKKAARLAVRILKAADPGTPIKLSVEASNEKAQTLYKSIGFTKLDEMDGDDLVFGL